MCFQEQNGWLFSLPSNWTILNNQNACQVSVFSTIISHGHGHGRPINYLFGYHNGYATLIAITSWFNMEKAHVAWVAKN